MCLYRIYWWVWALSHIETGTENGQQCFTTVRVAVADLEAVLTTSASVAM